MTDDDPGRVYREIAARLQALPPLTRGTTPTEGRCHECNTDGPYDECLTHLSICFWCAELQRIHPHPTRPDPYPARPNPARAPEWR